MLDILVAEISPQRPRIVPLVGQRVAARAPEHVRVRLEGKAHGDQEPLALMRLLWLAGSRATKR